jgi:phosphate transport system protein
MSLHLQREMEQLKKHVLSLCAMVEDQVETAIRSLMERDADLARSVEKRDSEIDRREVEVEEECLKTLALYQPVAIDLRFVVGVLKMNNDLERIGDLAVNIARKAVSFAEKPKAEIPFDLPGMWEDARAMLRDSIDALVNRDAALAHNVCARDDEVDRKKKQIRQKAEQWMVAQPQTIPSLLALLAASRSIERIADHATNIAEDVLYMVEGRIARHVSPG